MWKLNPWKWKTEKTPEDPDIAAEIQEELARAIPYPATVGEFLTAVLRKRPDIQQTVVGLREGETLTVNREPLQPITITAKAARVALAAALLEDPE